MTARIAPLPLPLPLSLSLSESRFRGRSTDLAGIVEDPAALFAANDFLAGFHKIRRRGRYFHVAAGANVVLQGNYGSITLAGKHTIETIEQIFIDAPSEIFSLL